MKKVISKKDNRMLFALCATVVLFSAEPALAQTTTGAFGPIQTAVQMIIDFITGPFGRSLAVLAVIGLGVLAFAGRISWMACFLVIIGIGLVFGAPAIVDQMISSVGS